VPDESEVAPEDNSTNRKVVGAALSGAAALHGMQHVAAVASDISGGAEPGALPIYLRRPWP
jgi:phage I-like protein